MSASIATQVTNKLLRTRAAVDPAYRARTKYNAELNYWQGELRSLDKWFNQGTIDWWGIKPPTEAQKKQASPLWIVNAIRTMHAMRPSYHEELKIERDFFAGKRVLEIGNGPLAPILQFDDCERHGIDPLNNMYMDAGWPLFAYDAKFISMGAERLPYPDEYFDAVLSVNALDHVDDFNKVASEMQRVVKSGGEIRFEVEYHQPTVTEPLQLNDAKVRQAFNICDGKVICSRTGQEMYAELARRYDLVTNRLDRFGDEQFVTWTMRR
jgi:ubiquinone/menaquinone biosynthesis C-methylase UbiE